MDCRNSLGEATNGNPLKVHDHIAGTQTGLVSWSTGNRKDDEQSLRLGQTKRLDGLLAQTLQLYAKTTRFELAGNVDRFRRLLREGGGKAQRRLRLLRQRVHDGGAGEDGVCRAACGAR